MTHEYSEVFLDDAMDCLGSAVEYAVFVCEMDGKTFLDLFITCGIAKEFGRGNVRYISGMSGIELARLVLEKSGLNPPDNREIPNSDYPKEYWGGWILAYYQWYTGNTFDNICKQIPFPMLMDLYGVLHEADPSKAVEVFDGIMAQKKETNLAYLRKNAGLSQSQLAKASNVSVRSIQLFEQRKSNINNAQYNHLRDIARVLHCEIQDLLD